MKFQNLLEDLRFVIGLLFAILGLIVLFIGIMDGPADSAKINLNLYSGAAITAFAVVMLGLALFDRDQA